MANSLWVTLQWKQSDHIFSHDQQFVSDIASERQSHDTHHYDQQRVSYVTGGLITSFPMTNSLWVTLHTFERQSHHIFPITNREWVTFYILWKVDLSQLSYHQQEVSDIDILAKASLTTHCIISYPQQQVSDIADFVKASLITYLPMTNSEWVTLHFVKASLIIQFPMTNRVWVTLHILWNTVLSDPFLWPTVCEWHCTFCE